MSANSNLIVFQNHTTVRFIFDADGESHQDVGTAWTNYDAHEDWKLAGALKASLMPKGHEMASQYMNLVQEYKPILKESGLVTYNDDGHHFIAMKRTLLFTLDGLFQTGEKVYVDHEQRLQHCEDIILTQQKLIEQLERKLLDAI